MKRRIIKGQLGIPGLSNNLTPISKEDAQDYYQLEHSVPYNEPWWSKTVRYTQNPFNIVSDYVESSDWAPDWLKYAMPYVGIGVGLAANKTIIPKVVTKQAGTSDPSSYRGQPQTSPEAEDFWLREYTGRRYDRKGFAITNNPTLKSAQRAGGTEVSLEDALKWKPSNQQNKPSTQPVVQAQQEVTQQKTSTNMNRQGSGRLNAQQVEARNAMYLRRGLGLKPNLSNTIVQRNLGRYCSAVKTEYSRLHDLLNAAIQAKRVDVKFQVETEIRDLRRNFAGQIKKARGMGYEIIVPDDIKKIMYP